MGQFSDVAVAGVYQTPQGNLDDRSQASVWWECAKGAAEDAGVPLSDIDGLIMHGPQGAGLRETMPAPNVAELLGHPIRFHATNTVGAGSSGAALNLAAHAVKNGLANAVLIVNAVAGKGVGYTSSNRDQAVAAMAKLSGPYEYVYGTTRVSDYSILAMRHMYEYGTTSEQLAAIAVSQRHGAVLHPKSVNGHRGEITVEDVMNSRMIATPLHLLDSCAINQGGGAVVVTKADNVRAAGKHAPVVLLGYGEGHSHIDPCAVESLAGFSAANVAAETAFAQADVSREDIDVAAVSDHFTIGVLLGLEDAGFCKKGEGGAFVENGGTGPDGHLPTNTSGGFLSFSHAGMCGIFPLIEIVDQLRGDAGPRQVKDAKLAFVNYVGGAQQAHASMILGRA